MTGGGRATVGISNGVRPPAAAKGLGLGAEPAGVGCADGWDACDAAAPAATLPSALRLLPSVEECPAAAAARPRLPATAGNALVGVARVSAASGPLG